AARVDEDGLVRDARAVAPPAAVAGDPDDLALEAAAPEDAVGRGLGLVHRVMAQVDPEAAAGAQAGAHRGKARLEHLDEGVDAAEVIVVGEGAVGALHAAGEPRP